MRKPFLISTLLLGSLFASAQETDTLSEISSEKARWTSKRGVYIFPEKGEWAIGFSATSLLAYAGSFFTTANFVPTFSYANVPPVAAMNGFTPAVTGKYMLKDNQAIRARFQWAVNTFSSSFSVPKALLSPDPFVPEFVQDKSTSTNTAFLLSGGYEWRRGKGRVKGVYGAEGIIGSFGFRNENTYGNAMSADFPSPPTFMGPQSPRVTSNRITGRWYMGARAFAGIEYFFVPKISLGGEFGYNLGFSAGGVSETKFEVFDTNTGTLRNYTVKNTSFMNNSGFNLGLDDFNAGVNFCFYF